MVSAIYSVLSSALSPVEDRIWSGGAHLIREVATASKSTSFQKVIDYLAVTSHCRLQEAAKARLAELKDEGLVGETTQYCAKALSPAKMKALYSLFSPETLRVIAKLQGTMKSVIESDAKLDNSGAPTAAMRKMVQGFKQSRGISRYTEYFLKTIFKSYAINPEIVPTMQVQAQMQITFWRNLLYDGAWIVSAGAACLSSLAWRGRLVAAAAFASLALLYRRHLGFSLSYIRDCRNLCDVYKKGDPSPLIGRHAEFDKLKTAILSGGKYPLLVADPGVGKTALVEGLAHEIVNGNIPALQGYTVFVANTAKLLQGGGFDMETGRIKEPFDYIVEQVKGFENKVILFFDEFHAVAKKSVGASPAQGPDLADLMKTELMAHGLKCIMATTGAEYEECIKPNKALGERLSVMFLEPSSPEDLFEVLVKTASKQSSGSVVIEEEGIGAIIKAGAELYPRDAEPRRSRDLLLRVISHVRNVHPQKVSRDLEGVRFKLEKECSKGIAARLKDPKWMETAEGGQILTQIDQLEKEVNLLKERKIEETRRFKELKDLRQQIEFYDAQVKIWAHELKNPKRSLKKRSEMEKNTVFLNLYGLPQAKEVFRSAVEVFGTDFEHIPTKVDKATVDAFLAHFA